MTYRLRNWGVLSCVPLLSGLGCAAELPVAAPEPEQLGGSNVSLESDLALGSQGEDVAALHAYLGRYAYLPNEEVQRRYPHKRPYVDHAPTFEDVFDERTEEAVKALQQNVGLPSTGVVDARTRELLHTPRCGHVDGVAAHESEMVEKFAHYSYKIPSSVTWRVINGDDGLSIATAAAELRAAFAAWSNETKVTFSETSSTSALVNIAFTNIDGPGGVAAMGTFPVENVRNDLTFDVFDSWSVSSPTPAHAMDVRTIALHEIGHLMGLDHSSIAGATMWPWTYWGTQDRSLHPDDKVAVSAKYDKWLRRSGSASDIAAAVHGSSPSAWIVTKTAAPGGFTIAKWTGASWATATGGQGALRISANAESGAPWIVTNAGSIFRRNSSSPSSGSWEAIAGCATDIAVGITTDAVWAIGCDGGVWQRNHLTGAWENRFLPGKRIAVDRNGVAWVVQSNGNIFRRIGGAWHQVSGCATDIGAWRNTWVTGCSSVSGGRSIYVWNEQPELWEYPFACNANATCTCPASSDCPGMFCDRSRARCAIRKAPARSSWLKVSGGAMQIAVGATGPWLVNSSGAVFQQDKPGT